MADANILSTETLEVKVGDLKPFGKNPRKGDVEMIAESLKAHGQYRPLIVRKGTGEVLAGNHTLKAAISLKWKTIAVNYIDVDEDQAKRIVLVDNRTQDAATYDTDLLAEILSTLPNADQGTGFDDIAVRSLLAGMEDRDAELVTKAIRPAVEVNFEGAAEEDWDLATSIREKSARHDIIHGDEGVVGRAGMGTATEEMRVAESIASIQTQLEPLQDSMFTSSNYWGVPDLRRDMLLDVLPDDLTTWGGKDATPDDGKSTYLWNVGLANTSEMPWARAIAAFFTYDTKFEPFMAEPAFKIAQVLHNGLTRAIVPDTSMWLDDTRFHHLSAAWNAQWMGRFMQEAGMKVIPRFMWCDLESIKTGVLGIPKSPPIAAVCMQAIDKKEAEKQMTPDGLKLFVKEITPDALIVYGGGTARKIVEQAMLPKSLEVRFVPNYADVRRHIVYGNQTGKTAVEKAKRSQAREAKQAAKAAANHAERASRSEDDTTEE